VGPLIARVLVGIDFSPESDTALSHAVVLARHIGAQIALAHVIPLPTDLIEDSAYDPLFRANILSAELTAERRVDAKSVLMDVTGRCRELGVDCEPLVIDDNPSDGLARAAEQAGAGLIVVGTHGRTGIKRILLGSVAERTVRLAACHTLVARGPIDPERGYRRILVATDFSPHAESALDVALAIGHQDAPIEVIHCWQPPVLPAGLPVEPVRSDLERRVDQAGTALLERRTGTRPIRFLPVESAPSDGIRSRVEETGADLIVVGSHGRRGVRRWLLGSIAETTVRHAPCSVLVVRLPGHQGDIA
jgi:nucleotide-binding universal stress UspA family protein